MNLFVWCVQVRMNTVTHGGPRVGWCSQETTTLAFEMGLYLGLEDLAKEASKWTPGILLAMLPAQGLKAQTSSSRFFMDARS